MTDSAGKTVKAAYPGDAITVSGWKDLPAAGDEVLQGSEPDIKKALANRARKSDLEQMLEDVDVINEQRRKERELRAAEALAEESGEEVSNLPKVDEEFKTKELPLLIKGDVSGSVEALMETLKDIGNDVARAKVTGGEVGEVTASDVMRAKVGGGASFY
jgi:translation initiation factor IF-2